MFEFVQIDLQLLFFAFCLSVLGEPIRVALRKLAGLFISLDLLQIFVLDIYFGGVLLYVLAILPLQLFSASVLYATTLVSAVTVLAIHRRRIRSFPRYFRSPRNPVQVYRSYELILVVFFFLFSFVLQTLPVTALFFGSVRDTAVHSTFTQVLIENRQVPFTLRPYLNEGIIYPQGFTPTVAYSVFLLNYSPPQAVFYVTALFNSLTILGVYFLGKMLSLSEGGKIGLSLAFIFTFVASWPKYMTWGSNSFVASFPLYFVCLSVFPLLMKERLKVGAIEKL